MAASSEERAEAFAQLLNQSLDRSYRLAAVILGSPDEAEDATHDAAVRAWHRMDSLRDRAKFEAWFQRILINVCRSRLRERRRPTVLMHPSASPDLIAMTAEREALRGAMATLSFDHRTAVVLRYLADLSIDQIAERTRVRSGTVKSRLHYAIAQLRAAYDAAERLASGDDE